MSPTIRIMIAEVLPHFGLESEGVEILLSKDRHQHIAEARLVAMWLARKKSGRSFPSLGREFGNRDHTTIQSAVRRVDQELARNPEGRMAVAAQVLAASVNAVGNGVGLRPTGGSREFAEVPLPPVKIEIDEGPTRASA